MPEGIAEMPWWILPGLVLALIGLIGAIIKISMWAGSVNADRSVFKKFMEELRGEFKEMRNNFKEVLDEFKEVRDEFKKVRDDFKELRTVVNKLNGNMAPSTTLDSESPLHLN